MREEEALFTLKNKFFEKAKLSAVSHESARNANTKIIDEIRM
jgi:hypothetical protein